MASHRLFVEVLSLAADHRDGALRTVTEARPEAVAVDVADQPRFAVDDRDRPLGAGGNALASDVTELLVDLHHLANRHVMPPWTHAAW
jgi:hypothetical protein